MLSFCKILCRSFEDMGLIVGIGMLLIIFLIFRGIIIRKLLMRWVILAV
jgi:hypothetical protein